jgi:hypothetical protein
MPIRPLALYVPAISYVMEVLHVPTLHMEQLTAVATVCNTGHVCCQLETLNTRNYRKVINMKYIG